MLAEIKILDRQGMRTASGGRLDFMLEHAAGDEGVRHGGGNPALKMVEFPAQ